MEKLSGEIWMDVFTVDLSQSTDLWLEFSSFSLNKFISTPMSNSFHRIFPGIVVIKDIE